MSEFAVVSEQGLVVGEVARHVQQVKDLLDQLPPSDARDELQEARAKAEAAALLARRTQSVEREREFAKIRLLAEAGLGVLSLDGVQVDPRVQVVSHWRALAAAFERGRLLEFLDDDLTTQRVVASIRAQGWTLVPASALRKYNFGTNSVRWPEARRVCRDFGIDPRSLPPDPSRIQAEREARAWAQLERSKFVERERNRQRQRRIDARVRPYPAVSEAYGFLRQTLDALGRVDTSEMPAHRKTYLNQVFDLLYRAEDLIAKATPDV